MTSWTRKTIAAAAIAALIGPGPGFAQTHKTERPDAVVRAIGVYEWTGDLTKPTGSRFVPISLFIDGELEDAAVYKPQPVPFALLTGNVYELEDAGLNRGTLVLEQAMKAVTPDGAPASPFIDGWTAYGSYKPPIAEKKAAPLRASKTVPAIQVSGGDSSRPHFSNKPDTSAKQSDASDSTTKTTSDSSAKTTSDTSAKNSDDDSRPTLHRRTDPPAKVDDETTPQQDPNSASSMPKDDDDDRAERPTLRRQSPDDIAKNQKEKKKEKESASVTAAGSISDDPGRPTLKHGSQHAEDDELPKLNGVPTDMKQMIAVSDAKNRAAHVFARPWEDMSERSAILTKMQALGRAKLAQYGTVAGSDPPQLFASSTSSSKAGASINPASGAQPSAPKLKRGVPTDDTTETASVAAVKPAPSTSDPAAPKLKRGVPTDDTTQMPLSHASASAKTTTAAKTNSSTSAKTAPHTTAKGKKAAVKAPPAVELADEQLRGYLLSYGGAPTYVYTAHTVEPGNVTRFITVVAQADTTGQLKVALASATDAAHLDRTPWMRLVDAVDVEASNRASLLFELRGRSSRQFALYRVIANKPEQIFTTSM